MKNFSTIYGKAKRNKGGEETLQALLPEISTKRKLNSQADSFYLAMMTKVINQAGFNWAVIEKKWPQFEDAFLGFELNKLNELTDAQWEAYASDPRVVRNWQKISAVRDNLELINSESAKFRGFGRFLTNWPDDDQIGLMAYLKKHGSRLGGQTSQWFFRYVGKDGFILSPDVIRALKSAGLDIADIPTSQRDLRKIQDAMNAWQCESGLPYAHVSRIAACSVSQDDSGERLAS